MNNRKSNEAAAEPDLLLRVVERDFAFRACNYSLYPSRLAYPWSNAYLVIRGTRPYSVERHQRGGRRSGALALQDATTQYREGLDAAGVAAALLDFAQSAPRPALVRLDLNTGGAVRRLAGPISVLGCRLAAAGKSGELAILGGVEFEPPPRCEPGGREGPGERHRIVIQPGTQVRFALPLGLAEAARRRPRPEQCVVEIEALPSVFVHASTFRALWPEGPEPAPDRSYAVRSLRQDAAVAAI